MGGWGSCVHYALQQLSLSILLALISVPAWADKPAKAAEGWPTSLRNYAKQCYEVDAGPGVAEYTPPSSCSGLAQEIVGQAGQDPERWRTVAATLLGASNDRKHEQIEIDQTLALLRQSARSCTPSDIAAVMVKILATPDPPKAPCVAVLTVMVQELALPVEPMPMPFSFPHADELHRMGRWLGNWAAPLRGKTAQEWLNAGQVKASSWLADGRLAKRAIGWMALRQQGTSEVAAVRISVRDWLRSHAHQEEIDSDLKNLLHDVLGVPGLQAWRLLRPENAPAIVVRALPLLAPPAVVLPEPGWPMAELDAEQRAKWLKLEPAIAQYARQCAGDAATRSAQCGGLLAKLVADIDGKLPLQRNACARMTWHLCSSGRWGDLAADDQTLQWLRSELPGYGAQGLGMAWMAILDTLVRTPCPGVERSAMWGAFWYRLADRLDAIAELPPPGATQDPYVVARAKVWLAWAMPLRALPEAAARRRDGPHRIEQLNATRPEIRLAAAALIIRLHDGLLLDDAAALQKASQAVVSAATSAVLTTGEAEVLDQHVATTVSLVWRMARAKAL